VNSTVKFFACYRYINCCLFRCGITEDGAKARMLESELKMELKPTLRPLRFVLAWLN